VYKASKEYPVIDDLSKKDYYTVRRSDLIGDHIVEKSKTDTLVRSLIRHDSEKLKKALVAIMEE